jgi:hypothetical protein
VRLRNGDVLEACIDTLTVKPDDELPAQWQLLEEKFRDVVDPVIGEERARELVDLVRRIDSLGAISELTEATAN